MATELELSSLLNKLKQLCSAGFEASLQLNSKDGQASVSLEVKLGSIQPISNGIPNSSKTVKQRRKRPQAYYRRQELQRQ